MLSSREIDNALATAAETGHPPFTSVELKADDRRAPDIF
jgi:hypothetical protein